METKEKELEVAVFDLNGTLYNKSSKDEFYKFICRRKTQKVLVYFELLYYQALQKLHVINQTEFKENFFNYLDHLPPREVEALAREFWQQEFPEQFNQELMDHIRSLRARGVKVVCISGGLELYVNPLFELFEIDGVAGTRVEYVDGTYLVQGEACKGKEKLQRLEKIFESRKYRITEAFSDSEEDILDAAEKAYLVKDGKLEPYPAKKAA
jgi:HAD superfamily hydrolase (TIGR01490 family)